MKAIVLTLTETPPPPQPHLLHVFPSFGVGGIQVRFAQIANHFGQDYRHTIVSLDGVTRCEERLSRGLAYARLDIGAAKSNAVVALLAARRQLSRIRPDLLLTYNWGAIEWALANRFLPVCRHVHFEDGFGKEEIDRQLPRRIRLRRFALGKAQRVVVPSRTLEAIALNIWRLRPDQVSYVPNGIDPARFAPDLARWRAGPDELRIGTVAPLRAEKNIARLIRAFARLSDQSNARLIIVGDGGERPALEGLARELGIADRVTFPGHASDPKRFLETFDIFAISSDTEQMPLNVLEAMSAGLPIAGVDVGDVKHMVAPQNKWAIVQREDEKGLSDALLRLLAEENTRATLGAANRMRATLSFSQNDMFAAYRRIYSL